MKAQEKTMVQQDNDNGGSAKKRGLGRGLGALFGDEETSNFAAPAVSEDNTTNSPRRSVGVDQLTPGTFQPRQHIAPDSLAELAESIAVHGILQPILVRPIAGNPNRYEIIAGERRWRAAQKAQLHEVPVLVREMDDVEALELALIENLQRSDLNALEEALGYKRLMDEFGHTQEKLAASMGKSRSHVANMMRLLGLPASVQTLIRQGQLTAGHARALVTAEDPESLARSIISEGLSVREIERLVAEKGGKKKGKIAAGSGKDVDTLALEKELTNTLGMKVTLDARGAGGTLKIDYKSLDQLDLILKKLAR